MNSLKRDIRKQVEELWKRFCTPSSTKYCKIKPKFPKQLWNQDQENMLLQSVE